MSGVASSPGSSGNLGPGFDVLALAVELRCTVTATPTGRWAVIERGEVFEPGPEDLVRRAAAMAVERPFRLEIDSAIPRARGLGSSSAVATAVAAAALRAMGIDPDSDRLFDIVAELEGHGDNAAAAVYGGLVLVSGGNVRHLEVHQDLRIVAAIPDARLKTDEARAALSDSVDRWAATRNLARLGFLVEGLRTGDPTALRVAGGDEMHEAPRASLSPVTGRLMDAARRAGAFHAAWSGAGPTAIAFVDEPGTAAVEAAMRHELDGQGEVRRLQIDTLGWQ
jgi:homoserine kinase